MLISKYDNFIDPYCYTDTFILKNKLNIKDDSELSQAELDSYSNRLEEGVEILNFDVKDYKNLHKHLFGDIYDWAGEYRKVSISKSGNMFCVPEFVDTQMEELFDNLKKENLFQNLKKDVFEIKIAQFLSDLNAIHPFREGNGRTQLSFVYFLCEQAGYNLDLNKLDPEEFLQAMIGSFDGDIALLEKIMNKTIYVKK